MEIANGLKFVFLKMIQFDNFIQDGYLSFIMNLNEKC